VQVITNTPRRVRAWSCAACKTRWAIAVDPRVFPEHLAATVEPAAARSALREIITLADQAPMLTDEQLRFRLRTLAECTRFSSNAAHRSPADRWLSEAPDSAPSGQPVIADRARRSVVALRAASLRADEAVRLAAPDLELWRRRHEKSASSSAFCAPESTRSAN
jgi:hypothetical protein